MKIKTKKVYYCDYCKKHGLSAGAMATHEKHCTGNPNRICRMCGNESIQPLIDKYKEQMSSDMKADEFTLADEKSKVKDILADVETCPMCALTIVRGSKLHLKPYNISLDMKDLIAGWWHDYAY